MIANFVRAIIVLVFLLAMPTGIIYLAGAFIKMSWYWFPFTSETERTIIAIFMSGIWLFIIYCEFNYIKDDRRI